MVAANFSCRAPQISYHTNSRLKTRAWKTLRAQQYQWPASPSFPKYHFGWGPYRALPSTALWSYNHKVVYSPTLPNCSDQVPHFITPFDVVVGFCTTDTTSLWMDLSHRSTCQQVKISMPVPNIRAANVGAYSHFLNHIIVMNYRK